MRFYTPIVYLEGKDFSSQGLQPYVHKNQSVLILIQGSFCGHCNVFGPVFQQFAEQQKAAGSPMTFATIQIDSSDEEEKQASVMIQKFVSFGGVPSVFGYRDGKFKQFAGPRTIQGLADFVKSI